MGSTTQYYLGNKRTRQLAQEADAIRQYNNAVEQIAQVLELIREQLRSGHRPATCDWVRDGSRDLASWQFYRHGDDMYTLNLLVEEGRFARFQRGFGGLPDTVHRLNPRRVESTAEVTKRKSNTDTLLEDMLNIVQAFAVDQARRFGVPEDDERFRRLSAPFARRPYQD